MRREFLYRSNELPFGRSWEEWTTIWCKWMLSIPKAHNPSLDNNGKDCSVNQDSREVWFLTGTFGNMVPIVRKCTIPEGRAIFFPIIEKEDSLAEDVDLSTDSDLIKRCRDAINKVVNIEINIDGENIEDLEKYRFQSSVFELIFPQDNVYNVRPGLTRSVCDGYWIFMKPLPRGEHSLHFKGENLLCEPYTTTQLQTTDVYNQIQDHIVKNFTFKLDVLYQLTIVGD